MKHALIALIELYRTYVSPTRMPTCRFTPTCSEYAVTALHRHGLWMGVSLTVVRLLKCGPWHPGGWDPVPPQSPGAEFMPAQPWHGACGAIHKPPHVSTNDRSS